MIVPYSGILSKFDYPAYIIHEFLTLLGNILEGQEGRHITDVVQEIYIEYPIHDQHDVSDKAAFFRKVLGVIARAQASPS